MASNEQQALVSIIRTPQSAATDVDIVANRGLFYPGLQMDACSGTLLLKSVGSC